MSSAQDCSLGASNNPERPARERVMNTPELMSIITKHVAPECVPNIRSACKMWNSTLVPKMRETHQPLKFNCSQQNARLDYDSLNELGRFTEVMRASSSIPFQKFHLHNISWDDRKVRSFFHVCGPHIVKVHMKFMRECQLTLEEFRNIVFCKLPMLKTLSISDERLYGFWGDNLLMRPFKHFFQTPYKNLTLPALKHVKVETQCVSRTPEHYPDKLTAQDFIMELVQPAINLEKLTFRTGIEDIIEKGEDGAPGTFILLPIEVVRADMLRRLDFLLPLVLAMRDHFINAGSLKELKFDITKNELRELSSMAERIENKLQLKAFDIRRVTSPFVHWKILLKFLHIQAESLTQLDVGLHPAYEDEAVDGRQRTYGLTIPLPIMSFLEHLRVEIFDDSGIRDRMFLHFRKYATTFPKLKTLIMENGMREKGKDYLFRNLHWYLHPSLGPHLGLVELHFLLDAVDLDRINALGDRFPNIRKLRIHLISLDDVVHLRQTWKSLEYIDVVLVNQPHGNTRRLATLNSEEVFKLALGIPEHVYLSSIMGKCIEEVTSSEVVIRYFLFHPLDMVMVIGIGTDANFTGTHESEIDGPPPVKRPDQLCLNLYWRMDPLLVLEVLTILDLLNLDVRLPERLVNFRKMLWNLREMGGCKTDWELKIYQLKAVETRPLTPKQLALEEEGDEI